MSSDPKFDYHLWNSREQKWHDMAERCKADADYKCQLCNDSTNLVAHHRIYRPLNGDEKPGDLTCLCHACHTSFHNEHIIVAGGLFRYKNQSGKLKSVKKLSKQKAANDAQYSLTFNDQDDWQY